VPDFKHTERISRQQAAERLTDVAYAMVVRAPVTLQIDGERVVVPDAEELLVDWDVSCADGRLELQMEVRWPAAELGAVA
jgi:amphi-Trp domain-containing protein